MIKKYVVAFFTFFTILSLTAQEGAEISFDIPSQNLLKFNRFLMNPTFSYVNEDYSYINFFHRNQWIQFDNSPQIYFLNYSGRINDKNGIGFGLYQQKIGVISSFGALVNYAYGIKLSEKNTLTFGFNMAYYNSGLDNGAAFPGMPDPALQQIENNSLLSFQPGINLSFGSFDFGIYAENLLDYNLKTSKSLTEFSQKTFSGHFMYTYRMHNQSGFLENGKLVSMIRGRSEEDFKMGGSVLLDAPKIGWLQAGYDDKYGMSGGLGFNITNRLSIGYTFEKGTKSGLSNMGPTHEIVFAYSFKPKSRAAQDNKNDAAAKTDTLVAKEKELQQIKKQLDETNILLSELIFRQDSVEKAKNADFENRFMNVVDYINMSNRNGQNTQNQTTARVQFQNQKTSKETKNTTTQKESTTKVITTPVVSKGTTSANASKTNTDNTDFVKQAKANNVKQETIKNLQGVNGGYYIIGNIFRNKNYLNAFVKSLHTKGIVTADSFLNPSTGLNYAYLQRYDTWQEAIEATKSKLNHTYNGPTWIMHVDNAIENNSKGSGSVTPQNKITEENKAVQIVENKVISTNSQSALVATEIKDTKAKEVQKIQKETEPKKKEIVAELKEIQVSSTVTAAQIKERYNENEALKKSNNTIVEKVNKIEEPVKKEVAKKKDVVAKSKEENATPKADATAEAIQKEYSKNTTKKRETAKIGPTLKINNQEGGYYIIANVFARPDYASSFVEKLRKKGLEVDYFINPINNYRYVYLKKHEERNGALASYYSNVNNTYYDKIWIMCVNTL